MQLTYSHCFSLILLEVITLKGALMLDLQCLFSIFDLARYFISFFVQLFCLDWNCSGILYKARLFRVILSHLPTPFFLEANQTRRIASSELLSTPHSHPPFQARHTGPFFSRAQTCKSVDKKVPREKSQSLTSKRASFMLES